MSDLLNPSPEARRERPQPVEIVGNHWIHRDHSDRDAQFYRREEVDRLLDSLESELAVLKAQPEGLSYDEHEREILQVIDQRDKAEEALSQAYFLVIGESPEWSNLFGHDQALEAIEDAVTLLRKSVALPVPDQAPVDGGRGTAWIAEIEAMALACDRLVLDAPLLNIKELRCRVEALSPFLQRIADIEQANPSAPIPATPDPRVEEIRRKIELRVLDELRMYMAVATVKNPMLMIDDFVQRYEQDRAGYEAEVLSELDRLKEGR